MRRTGPILIAVIGLFALVIDFWPNLYIPTLQQGEVARKVETKLGLDLQGGLKVEYRVGPSADRTPTLADVNVVKGIIEREAEQIVENAPLAVYQSRKVVAAAFDFTDPELSQKSREGIMALHFSEDSKEGPRAFVEKRKPVWKGS